MTQTSPRTGTGKMLWVTACSAVLGVALSSLAHAEETSPAAANPIYGGVIEFLYSQPNATNNKRFKDFQDSDFAGVKAHSHESMIRGRLNAGDGSGIDGRITGELTYQTAEVERSYPTGNLYMKHQFVGFNMGLGATWLASPMLSPYVEASLLLPAFKNEVRLKSSAGEAVYKDDYDDGSQFFLFKLGIGTAIGIDFRIYDSWQLMLHYDFWRLGSGKSGGLHVGFGYAL